MNKFLYWHVFKLKDCLKNGYYIIDVPKLLIMSTNNLRGLLENHY